MDSPYWLYNAGSKRQRGLHLHTDNRIPREEQRHTKGGPLRMPEPPSGPITFLFSDIEASPRLPQYLGDRYAEVLAAYR